MEFADKEIYQIALPFLIAGGLWMYFWVFKDKGSNKGNAIVIIAIVLTGIIIGGIATLEQKRIEAQLKDFQTPHAENISPKPDLPNKYEANVIQAGGTGSRILSKSAYQPDDHIYFDNFEDYVFTSFNTPADIMYITCRDGYKATAAHSATDNPPFRNGENTFGIELKQNSKNQLTVICSLD